MLYFNGASTVTYYFDRNIRGDVIRIYNPGGGVVAKYTYDAYGNCNIASGTTSFAVADANPIRYRGYYYDSDTRLYYLNARYYRPEWRRFISPDSTEYLDPENPNGLNLYAYCNNDPVNFADPSGHLGISLAVLGAIVLGIAGATAGGVIAYNVAKDNGAEGWDLFGYTMLGVLGGGLIGAAVGYGAGALITHFTGVLGLSVTEHAILSVNNITVLGHMETYINIAKEISASYFSIPINQWDMLSKNDQWLSNMKYLADAARLGSQFVVTAEKIVKEGSTLWKEIHFLVENNIPWYLP